MHEDEHVVASPLVLFNVVHGVEKHVYGAHVILGKCRGTQKRHIQSRLDGELRNALAVR